jgi:hypothetical protein
MFVREAEVCAETTVILLRFAFTVNLSLRRAYLTIYPCRLG